MWKLKEPRSAESDENSRETGTVTRRTKPKPDAHDRKRGSAAKKSLKPATNIPTSSDAANDESNEADRRVSASVGTSPIVEDPVFELQCLLQEECMIVFNPGEENAEKIAEGICCAIAGYRSTSVSTVSFAWPPIGVRDAPNMRSHGGWESAVRAFHSLMKRQNWKIEIVVTMGVHAGKVTENLPFAGVAVLKLDGVPTGAHARKELWDRIREIL